jgi:hypothetical protein
VENEFFVTGVDHAGMHEYASKYLQFVVIDKLAHADIVPDPFHHLLAQSRRGEDQLEDRDWSEERPVNLDFGRKPVANNPEQYAKFMLGQEISPNWLWELLNYQLRKVKDHEQAEHKEQLILSNTLAYLERKFSEDLPKDQEGQLQYLKKHFHGLEPARLVDRVPVWGLLFLQFRAGRHPDMHRTVDRFKNIPDVSRLRGFLEDYRRLRDEPGRERDDFRQRAKRELEGPVDDLFKHQLYYLLSGCPMLMSHAFVGTVGEQYWHYLSSASVGGRGDDKIELAELRANVVHLAREGRAGIAELVYVQAYAEALARIEKEMGFEEYLHVLIYLCDCSRLGRDICKDVEQYLLGFFPTQPELCHKYLKLLPEDEEQNVLRRLILDSGLVGEIFDLDRRQLKEGQVRAFRERLGQEAYERLAVQVAGACQEKFRQLYYAMRLYHQTGHHQQALQVLLLHELKQLQGEAGETPEERERTNSFKDRLLEQYLSSELLARDQDLYQVTCFLIKASELAFSLAHPEGEYRLSLEGFAPPDSPALGLVQRWLREQNQLAFYFVFLRMALQQLRAEIDRTKNFAEARERKELFRQVRAYSMDLVARLDRPDPKLKAVLD